jgi:hypothetical protein
MGSKPVPTKKNLKILKDKAIIYICKQAIHDIYDNPEKPLLRPVAICTKFKEIPPLHIPTSLENPGIGKRSLKNG